jgi:hypothetical protein
LGLIGYEIRGKEDKPLAAVSLIDNGVVYFNDISVVEKSLMANIWDERKQCICRMDNWPTGL